MKLEDFLRGKAAALAFSGGTDSALLLAAAVKAGCRVQPYFVHSAFQPGFELEDAKRLCAQLGVELVSRPVSTVRGGLVRHDPELLAAALLELHAQRSVRIAGLGRYRTEA